MLETGGAQGVRGKGTGVEPREAGRDQIRKDLDPFKIKSINSTALSFLYSPTLTSIHDYCPF